MFQLVSIKVNKEIKDSIILKYKKFEKESNGQYVDFFAQNNDLTITIYSNKKGIDFKVVFNGENALKEAKKFDKNADLIEEKESSYPTKASWICFDDQIGSDEVGVGDFLGPICVCAAFVKKSDLPFLKSLGVDDSKRLTDEKIREIGAKLIKKIEYSQVSLPNDKYNEVNEKNINMNEMKAKMHNQVLFNLTSKHKKVTNVFVDEFCKERTYYSYLTDVKEIVNNITFSPKGESFFPCVAVGSIIARFSFLQKMDALNEKYNVKIPFGAGKNADKFAKEFVDKFGIEEFNKIAKKNFANYKKLTE